MLKIKNDKCQKKVMPIGGKINKKSNAEINEKKLH